LPSQFSPEHGLAGRKDETDLSSKIPPAPAFPSLFSWRNSPSPGEMPRASTRSSLTFQTPASRFYTYNCNDGLLQEEGRQNAKSAFSFSPVPIIPASGGKNLRSPYSPTRRQTNLSDIFHCRALRAHYLQLARFSPRRSQSCDLQRHRHENLASRNLFLFFEDTGITWNSAVINRICSILRTYEGFHSLTIPGIECCKIAGFPVGRGKRNPV